ncbi:Aminopeptidase N [Acromyrmex echinatior]|uniref:Aminopeptidase N n=1 Tax=Acromyrmex echinatior TaxID=103372 RepID=F4X6K8_ACREC|nr:Aminopeptidase N [Acromyrmex echinatior]
MDTWTNQNSYPVVNVMKNYTTGEITIFQKCVCGQKSNNEWWIPITFATQSNPNFSDTAPRYWLKPNQNITFKIDPNDWIIVNIQQIGYYRVNYDIKNWEKISNYLNSENFTNIHVINRAQIIDDLFDFVDGRISGFVFLNLVKYLQREVDCVAWYPLLFQVIPSLKNTIFLPEATYIKITIMTLLSYLFQNIGYLENIDDNDITKQVRLRAIKWACIIDDKFFKNTIDFKLNQHLVDELYRMSPEHNFMYCIDLMAANRTTWDKILELYQKTDPKEENFKTISLTTTEIIKLILGNVFYDKQIDKMKVFSDANFAHDPITRNAIKKLIQKQSLNHDAVNSHTNRAPQKAMQSTLLHRYNPEVRLEAIKWACTLGDGFCKNTIAFKLSRHLADLEL